MSTRFLTNRRDNTLIDKFAGVFSNNPDIQFFDASAPSAIETYMADINISESFV